jgi:SAM-dependent methyltransferase
MNGMREIICPICGGADKTVVYESRLSPAFDETTPPSPYSSHYRINRCACGLLYSSPIMDEVGVAALYEKSSETNVAPGEEDNVRRTMRLYFELAVPHLAARERVLDIGCDMGFLLEAARAAGFVELHGIEPNPVARRIAAARLPGARVSARFFEQTDYPADHFDLIAMIHVLDHLFDPATVLRRALASLRPGGLVIAVVHNVHSALGRLLGERFPIFNLYHHYFFDKSTLAALFRAHGFEVIRVASTYNCYSLGFFAQRIPGLPTAVRRAMRKAFDAAGIGLLPLTIALENIGIVARRPAR